MDASTVTGVHIVSPLSKKSNPPGWWWWWFKKIFIFDKNPDLLFLSDLKKASKSYNNKSTVEISPLICKFSSLLSPLFHMPSNEVGRLDSIH